MYHIIAVDDETKALERFVYLASEEPRIVSLKTFTDPVDAVEYCKSNRVDIAFLDIDMPRIKGLLLAEMLRDNLPLLDVVFVTAYDQYAMDAFRVHAYDYLLKPIGNYDLSELIDRLDLRATYIPTKPSVKTLYVQCFGSFLCYLNQDNSSQIRFRTAKSEELFALLLQYNERAVTKEQIIDNLWPEIEPEKAANYFRVTCTYLRKALENKGLNDILCRDRDSYMLNTDLIDCDMHKFLTIVKSRKLSPGNYSCLEDAVNLYTAPYFEDRIYEWSFKFNLMLVREYKQIQNILADEEVRQRQYKLAIDRIKIILIQDPFDEATVIKLISIMLESGDTTSANITYNQYKEDLWRELSLTPSLQLQKLIK